MANPQLGTPTINAVATIVNATAPCKVSYTFLPNDTVTPGSYEFVWQAITPAGRMQFPTVGWNSIQIKEDLGVVRQPRMTSLDRVKRHLNIPADKLIDDDSLLLLMDAAVRPIEHHTGPVLPRKYLERHDGGNSYIMLYRDPVISVDRIVEYWGNVSYELQPANTPDLATTYSYSEDMGMITRRAPGGTYYFPPGKGSVVVQYTAGRQPIPPNIEWAFLEAVRENWSGTESGGHPGLGQPADPEDTDSDAMFFLSKRVMGLLQGSMRGPSVV